MKSLLAIFSISALLLVFSSCGVDSSNTGTARGNDTITTEDRYWGRTQNEGVVTGGEGEVNTTPEGTSVDTIGAGNASEISNFGDTINRQ